MVGTLCGWPSASDFLSHLIEEDVYDWRGVKGKNLTEQQAANHRDAQRMAEL